MKSQLESMSEQVSKMETSVKMKMAKPFAVEEAAAGEGKTNEKKYDCQEDVQKVSGRASWFQGKKDGHLARMSERMR